MIFHASLGGFQPVQRRESAFLFGCWGGDNGHMCPKLKERSIIFAHFQVYHSELVNPSSQLGNIPGLLPWTAPVVRYPAHLSSPDIATIREHFSKTWGFGKKMLLIMILGLSLDPITKQRIVHTAFILSCKSWRKPRRNSAEARSGWQKLTRLHRSLKGIHLRGIWVAVP